MSKASLNFVELYVSLRRVGEDHSEKSPHSVYAAEIW